MRVALMVRATIRLVLTLIAVCLSAAATGAGAVLGSVSAVWVLLGLAIALACGAQALVRRG